MERTAPNSRANNINLTRLNYPTTLRPVIKSACTPASIRPSLRDGSFGARCPRHFVPGYDHATPPGHLPVVKAKGARSARGNLLLNLTGSDKYGPRRSLPTRGDDNDGFCAYNVSFWSKKRKALLVWRLDWLPGSSKRKQRAQTRGDQWKII